VIGDTCQWPESSLIAISIPFDVPAGSVESILSPQLGQHDRLSWRLMTYSPSARRYIEYGVDQDFPGFELGRSYWLSMSEARRLQVTVDGAIWPQDQEFRIPLSRGHNQIASPFAFPLSFDSLMVERNGERVTVFEAAQNGWVTNQLWYFDNDARQYVFDTAGFGEVIPMEPWKGYWLYARKNVDLILPPVEYSGTKPVLAMTSANQTNAALTSPFVFLTDKGDLLDGHGRPMDSCGMNWDIARDMALWQDGFLVLDGFGGLHALAGAEPLPNRLNFGFDIARCLATNGEGYYILDGYGVVHAGEGCTPVQPRVLFNSDLARDLELVEVETRLNDPIEERIRRELPVPPPPGEKSMDSRLAYYVLDAFGKVHALDGALDLGSPEFDRPVAVDMAVTPKRDGYYVVDAYGHVFGFGNAPVFEEDTPVFDSPRIEKIVAAPGGYYLLDSMGMVYGAGSVASGDPLGLVSDFDHNMRSLVIR
jgi:hypothetical protein